MRLLLPGTGFLLVSVLQLCSVTGKVAVYGGKTVGVKKYNECEYLPEEEKIECEEKRAQKLGDVPWWGWLVLSIVILIILIVLIRRIQVSCSEEDEDAERKERRKKRRHQGCGWTQRKDTDGNQAYRSKEDRRKSPGKSNNMKLEPIEASRKEEPMYYSTSDPAGQYGQPPVLQYTADPSAQYAQPIGVLQYPIHPHHDVIGEAGPDPTYEAPPEYFQTMQMYQPETGYAQNSTSVHTNLPPSVQAESSADQQQVPYAQLRKKERNSIYV